MVSSNPFNGTGAAPECESRRSNRIVVVIASSDNTRDVFLGVFPALQKHWRSCPYEICVGFNEHRGTALGFKPIYAPVGGWGKELAGQLEQVSAEHILLLLDDFLVLQAIDTQRLVRLVSLAMSSEYLYLRLVPLRRPLAYRRRSLQSRES